jgi:hypothetical protein
MGIPTAGLVNKWDAFDPACYNPASPTQLTDLVGSIAIPIGGSPVFNAEQGSLDFSGADYAYTASGTRPFINYGGNWTISTWVKFKTLSADEFQIFLLGQRNRANPNENNGLLISMVTNTGVVTYKYLANAQTRTITPNNYGGIDTWNNITVTGNYNFGYEVRVYWNGVDKTTNNPFFNNSTINGDSRLYYSGFPGMTYSNNAVYGPMLIYNQTKTAFEVQDIFYEYYSRLNISPPPPVMGGRIFGEGLNG